LPYLHSLFIIYDKLSGLNSQEKREIGILRAVGWSMEDILKERFYEASIISILSFVLGYIISLYYVYILKAPLLRGVFEGYSKLRTEFNLPFHFDNPIALIAICVTLTRFPKSYYLGGKHIDSPRHWDWHSFPLGLLWTSKVALTHLDNVL